MQFGVLAGNSHINSRIYEMFNDIEPSDRAAFVKKFKTESDRQRFHTFRELVIGSHLRRQGMKLRYAQKILGKTPDWVLLDAADKIVEILDVVTLHQREAKETDIMASVSFGQIWSGWITIPSDHIYSKIERKANAYAALVGKINRPYVVCLFGEFFASVDPEEVRHVLYEHHGGALSKLPTLAGVIFFFEESGTYRYSYFANHAATYPSSLLTRS